MAKLWARWRQAVARMGIGRRPEGIVTVDPAGTLAETRKALTALHNLPPSSAVFVGRDLDDVDNAFVGDVVVIGQARSGLDGVGKTELALQFAHAHAERYPLRWWLVADSPDNITLGLAALAERLHPMASLPDSRAWAITYLQANPGWLLGLDNVEDLNHITACHPG
jgi:hypothetical protein